jgi:hypothetical protein
MITRINTIDRTISEDGLSDVCKTVHYSFYKQKVKDEAVEEVLYAEGDEIPEGKKIGDVKTPASLATYYSASSIGTVGLDAPDSENFTAYADITEEDAQGWVEAKIGADRLAEIEASLDAQIAEQETPTRGTGKPW